jgi:RNA-directed DNA polymerase
VKRRTSRKKLRASTANFTAWIKKARHQRIGRILTTLNSKYRGYWNYYGVIGNSKSLRSFFNVTQRLLFKWLNRRSQRRSYTRDGFNALINYFGVVRPRITERPAFVQLSFL